MLKSGRARYSALESFELSRLSGTLPGSQISYRSVSVSVSYQFFPISFFLSVSISQYQS
ncbi:hypothetical protein Q31a_24940 [Aureliella helgolandensis]|uniref:Uncharacterized protein n=1 Tax=Aureliella helgolandensis TaxID=2527968 RepID=A0A518G6G5_9BACT|nr:hypothetical protein Q31a_24940 [Aureliella helgolandensis]